MLIFDAHLDHAWNALQYERDLLKPVHVIRQIEAPMQGKSRAMNTVALPELRTGRVYTCFATLLARASGRPSPDIEYASVEQAHAIARGQLAYYRVLETAGHIRIITNRAEFDAHESAWLGWERAPDGLPQPPLGFVISMECADPVTRPEELAEWHALGLRVIGPAHYGANRYAGGTSSTAGLTEGAGPALLREMARLGIALDCTHLSDEAFWQAVRVYDGPLLASHQNCRAIAPMQRQFTDAQIKTVIERGGVLGASFDIVMVRDGWQWGAQNNLTDPHPITMREIVDHIDHICQLAGNSEHAGIGSDLDGGFGREQSPRDLDTIADLQKLAALLADRGYKQGDIENITHKNWSRWIRRAW
jgi:membrane dipeptidase